MNQALKEEIKKIFWDEGFVLVGFLGKEETCFGDWISDWLKNRFHGDMKWMERYRSIREDPSTIEPWCTSIITAAFPYHTEPPAAWEKQNPISNYAWGRDYHTVLKKKLKSIAAGITVLYPEFRSRSFVDSAPLPEKILAVRSGLGWIGKNGMLINAKYGSYLFLCEMVTNLALNGRKEVKNRCGTCVKCIEACPTQAIREDSVIDARRCISYLTIEKPGEFSSEEANLLQFQLFGCDICQQCCPFNRKIKPLKESPFSVDEKWLNVNINDISNIDNNEFERLKRGSPIKRTGAEGLRRNARAVKSLIKSINKE